jgi:hypothetical protein
MFICHSFEDAPAAAAGQQAQLCAAQAFRVLLRDFKVCANVMR